MFTSKVNQSKRALLSTTSSFHKHTCAKLTLLGHYRQLSTDFQNALKSTTPPSVFKSYINGKYVESSTGQIYDVKKPHTGSTLAPCQVAGTAEVDLAVKTANDAQKKWARFSGMERSRILRKAADLLDKYNDELALCEAMDTGRPIQETKVADIVSAKECIEYYSGLAPTLSGRHVDLGHGNFAYTKREPVGTVGAIGAWNYPIQGTAWKVGPALCCGNSIIFKPAEDTPWTTLLLAEILTEAGLPDGVFNVVLGEGSTGQLLSVHQNIDKISFTGEVGTGKKIIKDATNTLKKITMELGGKSPIIIFNDADINEAVSGVMMGNFYSAGEVCSNGTRVFVHKDIKEIFLQQLVERTKKISIGNPMDESTQMGPLIHAKHLENCLKYVEIGKSSDGADLILGGNRIVMEGELSGGSYMEPTIFDNCTDDMTIVKEEIFGPVASILTFESEEEALERANNTIYGLAAGVFTKDIQRAHRVIDGLKAGFTWINNYNLTPVELPWGGYKQSGLGRENGVEGIEGYSQVKSVWVEMNKIDCPYD